MIDIYTDGACSGNPGPGGMVGDHHRRRRTASAFFMAERSTDHQQPHGGHWPPSRDLRATPPSTSRVTDAHRQYQYLINTMTRGLEAQG